MSVSYVRDGPCTCVDATYNINNTHACKSSTFAEVLFVYIQGPNSHSIFTSSPTLLFSSPFGKRKNLNSFCSTVTHIHKQSFYLISIFFNSSKLAIISNNKTSIHSSQRHHSGRSNMVQEVLHGPRRGSGKGSLDYVLNTPQSSFDCNNLRTYLPDSVHSTQAADLLLDVARSMKKRSMQSTATSSDTTRLSSDERSKEVVQHLKPKRRKRKETPCEYCGRTFGDSSSKRKHVRVVHFKIKEFKCQECDKVFAEKSNLSKHVIAAHRNQRSHPCPDCDKVFNFTDGLRRHRNNVHLNLRPYPCDLCNTSYKQKTHLIKHKQSVHGVQVEKKPRYT